jgi:hypothetical protein
MLERNRRLNALSVTIFDCAAGTESGRTAFFDTADPSCCALLPINRESASQVDIEGYERFLFADAPEWLFQVSAIVGEIHEGYGIAQVRRDLAPYGFDVSISSPPKNTARRFSPP